MTRSEQLYRPVKRRKNPRKRGVRLLLVGIGVLWLLYLFLGGDYGLLRIVSLKREIARVEARIVQLRAKKVALERERRLLEGDPATIERIAREKFGMTKEEGSE